MVVLSEKLKGKTEFFCRGCGFFKPICALGRIITTPKKEDYHCSTCVVKAERNVQLLHLSKKGSTNATKVLKSNVVKYIEGLNLKTTE